MKMFSNCTKDVLFKLIVSSVQQNKLEMTRTLKIVMVRWKGRQVKRHRKKYVGRQINSRKRCLVEEFYQKLGRFFIVEKIKMLCFF